MLRRGLIVLASLAVAGCAGVSAPPSLPSSPRPAAGPTAELPAYSLGERWIRSDGIFELIRFQDGAYVFASEDGTAVHLTKSLGLAKVVYGNNPAPAWEFKPAPQLDWPLWVGKRGATKGRLTYRIGEPAVPSELQWHVEGYEDVETPGGTFKTFRILFTAYFTREWTRGRTPQPCGWLPREGNRYVPCESASVSVDSKSEFRVWYAPDVRQFVRSDSDTAALSFSLVAVDPGDTAPLAIALQEPKDQARVGPFDEVVASGRITGGKGVARVTVSLNGAAVATEEARGEPKRLLLLRTPLKGLRPDKNVIIVSATDVGGQTTQEARTIHVEPSVRIDLTQSPGQVLRVDTPHAVLVANVTEPKGVRFLNLSVGDLPVAGKHFAGAREATLEYAARLTPGENTIVVSVIEESDAKRTIERKVVLERSESPTAVVTALPAAGAIPSPVLTKPAFPSPEVAATREQVAVTPPALPAKPGPPAAAPPAPAPAAVAAVPAPLSASAFAVRLSSPADNARFEFDSIALAGLVSGGRGASRVVVTLNGQELTRVEERRPTVALNLPVRLREGQNTLVVTATDADGTPQQEVRTVHYEKSVPLSVEVRYPDERARLTQASTVLVAGVASSRGVARVGVTLNGAPVRLPDEVAAQVKTDTGGAGLRRSVALTVPVTLAEGTNVIVVNATEPDGTTRQAVRTVTYARPLAVAGVAPPAPLPAALPNRWAVVIGIGAYESPSVAKLKYAVNDADALYGVLTGPGGFKRENVLLLTDQSGRKPTLQNIKWALGIFLARSAKKDDTVFIFFAGHGAPEVDARGVENDGLAKYLVPIDADPDDLYSTGLPMDELQAIFGRLEAERVVVFLDACYSGAAGGRTFTARNTRAGALDDQFLERLTRAKGRAIITAARPTEVSLELDELRHGIFTYYLVEGLKGAADLNRDGIITLQELYEYVEQQVAQKSRAAGGNQHPIMKGELEGALPLVRVGGR